MPIVMTVDSMLHELFSVLLWLSGLGHFGLLGASLQVPWRLGWREELRCLRPFNRKLFWVYGGFTLLTIVAFGVLTLALHDELLRGDRAALGLSWFMALYWGTRLAVDCVWFSHRDWPPGRGLAIGHALLNLLFLFLFGTQVGLLAWHLNRN